MVFGVAAISRFTATESDATKLKVGDLSFIGRLASIRDDNDDVSFPGLHDAQSPIRQTGKACLQHFLWIQAEAD
jgi:hypothetical protein